MREDLVRTQSVAIQEGGERAREGGKLQKPSCSLAESSRDFSPVCAGREIRYHSPSFTHDLRDVNILASYMLFRVACTRLSRYTLLRLQFREPLISAYGRNDSV